MGKYALNTQDIAVGSCAQSSHQAVQCQLPLRVQRLVSECDLQKPTDELQRNQKCWPT